MPDEKKQREEPTFTVRDRRMFTAEGELKDEFREERAHAVAPDTPPPGEGGSARVAGETAQPQSSERARKEFAKQGPPRDYQADFTTLVASLATTAMYQLGMVRDARGMAPPLDLEAARHTIDMLGVIEEKTRGNLTAEEKQLLDQSLYDLRMSYLAIGKAIQEKGKKP